jgi:methionyl aminopeptidase
MAYARKILKPEMPLLEAVEKIESKIYELGAKPAFPVDLSCDEIAAHYSPLHDDKSVAKGLLKIDLGVALEGYPVDTASSVDLSPEQKYRDLIKASEESLKKIILSLKYGIKTKEIGIIAEETIKSYGFTPIRNLYGHELKKNEIHAGLRIPSFDDNSEQVMKEGIFAIEPFATTGCGLVINGKPSEVFQLEIKKPVRDAKIREILDYIEKEYQNLPFCARWLVKKFGNKALFALSSLTTQEILHHYPQLLEKEKGIVSQTEHTIMMTEDKVRVLT